MYNQTTVSSTNDETNEYSTLTKEQSQAISTIFEINEDISKIITTSVDTDVSSAFN